MEKTSFPAARTALKRIGVVENRAPILRRHAMLPFTHEKAGALCIAGAAAGSFYRNHKSYSIVILTSFPTPVATSVTLSVQTLPGSSLNAIGKDVVILPALASRTRTGKGRSFS